MKKILLGVMALMMGCIAVTAQPTPSPKAASALLKTNLTTGTVPFVRVYRLIHYKPVGFPMGFVLTNYFTKSLSFLFPRRNKAVNRDFPQSKPPLSPKETPTFLSPNSEPS